MLIKRIFSAFLAIVFVLQPVLGQAQMVIEGVPLPQAGSMVKPSEGFSPALLRGLIIDPNKPLQFDFILDQGNEKLNQEALKATSQRMINYFLASLALPSKDVWVNLSPVEQDRIIPDSLNVTELGRDLLAQDYLLKQLTASLIYPEDELGKSFWARVYDEAFKKFGVAEIPVDTFNKVWIMPEKASVYEKGNTVYITKAHLKVMLEADYQAEQALLTGGHVAPQGYVSPSTLPSELGLNVQATEGANPTPAMAELSKQIFSEIVVPAIEKEVNEGKNFAQLRQVFYAMILAQWFQDVFKQGILNRFYSGKGKVAGINLSDPLYKERIYQQYMGAYKKGVFNYIKDETDRLTKEPVAKKYFSGGFWEQPVKREPVSTYDNAATVSLQKLTVQLRDAAQESFDRWNDLKRPLSLSEEIKKFLHEDGVDDQKAREFFSKYSLQVDAEIERGNPVQGAWTMLKAINSLGSKRKKILADWVEKEKPDGKRTRLEEIILLHQGIFNKDWVKKNAWRLLRRTWYFLSMEIDFKAGGLGPVNVTHSKFMNLLGVLMKTIQPLYSVRFDTGKEDGEPLDYMKDLGYKELKKADDFLQFSIPFEGNDINVEVWEGINREGVSGYLIKDAMSDGTSYYLNSLYSYIRNTGPSKQEVMAFFNVAAAELVSRLEEKKAREEGRRNYLFPVIHPQDGQMGPFLAVLKSMFPWLNKAPSIGTTHTILNAGDNGIDAKGWFLKRMLKIVKKYVSAFITKRYFIHASGEGEDGHVEYLQHSMGYKLADVFTGVSWSHVVDMTKWYGRKMWGIANGDDPQRIASFFRQAVKDLQAQGKIRNDIAFDELLPQEVRIAKELCADRFNNLEILTANGEVLLKEAQKRFNRPHLRLQDLRKEDPEVGEIIRMAANVFNVHINNFEEFRELFFVNVDVHALKIGNARRLVWEKNNFDSELIKDLVQRGFNVVFMGNHQGPASDDLALKYRSFENEINKARKEARGRGDYSLYPGKFYFVQHFTEEEKIALLGMINIYFMANVQHLGANEIVEENPGPNYALQFALPHRDGGTTDWLIPVDFDNPGVGSLLMPREGSTREDWIKELFFPINELWKQGDVFFENAIASARMSNVMQGQLTAAAYLWTVHDFLEKKANDRSRDQKKAVEIERLIRKSSAHEVLSILYGHNHKGTFDFYEPVRAYGHGLDGFIAAIQTIEAAHGYDALFKQMHHYKEYILKLMEEVPAASKVMADWWDNWESSTENDKYKNERLQVFLIDLRDLLDVQRKRMEKKNEFPDKASKNSAVDGGIDLQDIQVARQGNLMPGVMTDKVIEGMFEHSSGLQGIIVSITPIMDVRSLLK